MDMSGQLVDGIDFSAMDEFMDHVQGVVTKEGTLIARVFPPDSDALVYFTDRLANDVVSLRLLLSLCAILTYITPHIAFGLHTRSTQRSARSAQTTVPPHYSGDIWTMSTIDRNCSSYRTSLYSCDR